MRRRTTDHRPRTTDDGTRNTQHATRAPFIAVALLLLFFLQVVTAATQTSLTSDEGPQLTSGYAYLVTGDPHLIAFDGHPPLAKVLNALPLLFVPDLGSPADTAAWSSDDPYSLIWVTQQFFYPYRPLDRLVFPTRVMVALLGVLLGALVYRWAADLFGPAAGLLALVLVTFDPNLLAHAGLATNDMAVTVGCFAAMFTFWRFLRRPTVPRALLAGLVLGLALGTKLNALLLLPVQGVMALTWLTLHVSRFTLHGTRPTHHAPRPPRFAISCALIWLTAALTLWASYGFELRTLPGGSFPLPAGTHLLLWQRVLEATGGGHPGFLMGQISTAGWWYYFPLAFAIKTPLPTLLVLLAAMVAFVAGRRGRWAGELALLGFAVLYTAATMSTRLNIGYRHLLPVLPFLYVFASSTAWCVLRVPCSVIRGQYRTRDTKHGTRNTQHATRFALCILLLWLVIGTARIWPFHLSYFNELIGGPDQGYRYLVDSNTDWGQALRALHRYMEDEGIERVRLSTFIEYEEAIGGYGIAFDPLPPLHDAPGVLPSRFDPPPGDYAISTTTLQGIFTADPEMYDWFRHREPDARLGHVMFVYRVAESEPRRWVAQCTTPVAPLTPEAIAEGFGQDDLRLADFDCTQGWLVPAGGAGWTVLFRDTARGDDDFVQAQLASSRLSFEQVRSTTLPPFAIYESPSQPATPQQPAEGLVQVGSLTFLGHTVGEPSSDRTLEVWTTWRVDARVERPLSLMLHLVGPGGALALAADGLAVPFDNWQVGDVIVQRHRFTLPTDAPSGPYTLATGAYWLDTMERWPVQVNGAPAGDQWEAGVVNPDLSWRGRDPSTALRTGAREAISQMPCAGIASPPLRFAQGRLFDFTRFARSAQGGSQ